MVLRDVQKHRELKKFANHCSRRLISKYFCQIRDVWSYGDERILLGRGLEFDVSRSDDHRFRGRIVCTLSRVVVCI